MIALLGLIVDLKDTFANGGICKSEAVQVLAYLLNGGTKNVYMADITNKMNVDAHVYLGNCPAAIRVLIKSFMTRNVLQRAHNLELRAFEMLNKN